MKKTKIKFNPNGTPPIEKAWDWNCTKMPEDCYDVETELAPFIGVELMRKNDFKKCVKKLFRDLYREIKHGDKEHQRWLKNKIKDFLEAKSTNPATAEEK